MMHGADVNIGVLPLILFLFIAELMLAAWYIRTVKVMWNKDFTFANMPGLTDMEYILGV